MYSLGFYMFFKVSRYFLLFLLRNFKCNKIKEIRKTVFEKRYLKNGIWFLWVGEVYKDIGLV